MLEAARASVSRPKDVFIDRARFRNESELGNEGLPEEGQLLARNTPEHQWLALHARLHSGMPLSTAAYCVVFPTYMTCTVPAPTSNLSNAPAGRT
jgi:hypothetical protein